MNISSDNHALYSTACIHAGLTYTIYSTFHVVTVTEKRVQHRYTRRKTFTHEKREQVGMNLVRSTEANRNQTSMHVIINTHPCNSLYIYCSYYVHVYILYGPCLLSNFFEMYVHVLPMFETLCGIIVDVEQMR